MTEHNGRFLLYYAVHTEPFRAAIRVAVAERPEGPFRDSGHDLTSASFAWGIDPHVFRDDDGQWYLFYTVEYLEQEGALTGSGNVMDRLLDPFTAAGQPSRVTPPRYAWQLFEAHREERGGIDWYCVEGPAVLRHRDRYYQLFSGGCYYRDNYAVSYAATSGPLRARGPLDPPWEDHAEDEAGLLMRGSATLIGPGHNSVVAAPNNVDLYLAYHAWPAERSERRACLDRLYWHGEAPWTPAPTVMPQPAPAMPRLRDLFTGATMDPAWTARAGRWRQAGGAVAPQEAGGGEMLLVRGTALGPAWLLEVQMRHVAGEGAYGVALGDDLGARLLLDPAAGRLEARLPGAGPATASLPLGFRPDAWHQLLIAQAGARLTVRLDGVPCLDTVAALHLRGLRALHRRLPRRVRRRGPDRSFPRRVPRGAPGPGAARLARGGRRATGAGLADRRGCPAAARALRGAADPEGRRAGPLRVRSDRAHPERPCRPPPGRRPAAPAARRGRAGGDPRAAGGILAGAGGGPRRAQPARAACELPQGFDPQAWHTLRLVRRETDLLICVDGPEMLSVAMPAGAAVPGLLTRGSTAAFIGAWQTGRP